MLLKRHTKGNVNFFHHVLFLFIDLDLLQTFPLSFEIFKNEFSLLFQSLHMLQLSSMLKSKALLLEKEAWGSLSTSLAGIKTSGLVSITEGLFTECSDSEEGESPPPKVVSSGGWTLYQFWVLQICIFCCSFN